MLRDRGIVPRLCYQAMLAAGIDGPAVYARLGVSVSALDNPRYSFCHKSLCRFWQVVEEVSGDPDVGFTIGRLLVSYRGEIFEYLFLSGPDFGTALRRFADYGRLASDAWIGRLGEDGDGAYLVFGSKDEEVNRLRHNCDCFALGLLHFFRDVTEGEFAPSRVDFAYALPADPAKRAAALGCPVRFDCAENRLYFDPALLRRPSSHAADEIFRLHDQIARRRLHRIEAEEIVEAVQEALAALPELSSVTIATVAARMDLSEAQLQYRLEAAGTGFQRELDLYRRQLACRLLAETRHSIADIVQLTGFSEPATFYRAFRRWEKDTPAGYRSRFQAARSA